MLKSIAMSSVAIALGFAAWVLPMRGEQATAQSGALHILVVEYDIVPAEIDQGPRCCGGEGAGLPPTQHRGLAKGPEPCPSV